MHSWRTSSTIKCLISLFSQWMLVTETSWYKENESWKMKASTEWMCRIAICLFKLYLQIFICAIYWNIIPRLIICKLSSYLVMTSLLWWHAEARPDKASRTHRVGAAIFDVWFGRIISCLPRSRHAVVQRKVQTILQFLRVGKRLGRSWDSSPALRKDKGVEEA